MTIFIAKIFLSNLFANWQELSFTISYGRYGDNVPKPGAVDNSDDCDWCLNTIYVKPNATNILLCSDTDYLAFGVIENTVNGYTSLMFKKLRTATSEDVRGNYSGTWYGQTSRGMMCNYFSSIVK